MSQTEQDSMIFFFFFFFSAGGVRITVMLEGNVNTWIFMHAGIDSSVAVKCAAENERDWVAWGLLQYGERDDLQLFSRHFKAWQNCALAGNGLSLFSIDSVFFLSFFFHEKMKEIGWPGVVCNMANETICSCFRGISKPGKTAHWPATVCRCFLLILFFFLSFFFFHEKMKEIGWPGVFCNMANETICSCFRGISKPGKTAHWPTTFVVVFY